MVNNNIPQNEIPDSLDGLMIKPHLRACDLPGPAGVTIEGFAIVEARDVFHHENVQKYAIRFVGKEKYLLLNKSLIKGIGSILGRSPRHDWPGKKITLYVNNQGKLAARRPDAANDQSKPAAAPKDPQTELRIPSGNLEDI